MLDFLGPIEKRMVAALLILGWLIWLLLHVALSLGRQAVKPLAWDSLAIKPGQIDRVHDVQAPFWEQPSIWRRPARNHLNPFYIHPTATPPPPAPPPAMRQVVLTYQGYYSLPTGDRQAFLQVGDQLIVGGVGVHVADFFNIAEITPQAVALRDPAGKTIMLEFNQKQAVSIPVP